MAKKKPARGKAAKAAAKKSTRRAAGKATTRRAKSSSRSARRPSAKKKATRKATRKSTRQLVARKAAARKMTKATGRAKTAAARKKATPPKKAAPKAAAKKVTAKKVTAKKVAAKKVAAKKITAATSAAVQAALPLPAAVAPKADRSTPLRPKRPPTLDRARKTVAPIGEEAEPHGLPSSLDVDRSPSAARSGRKELGDKLREHTSTSPSITAGDVDADWEAAESVGDEAPGGDNPTPDQDVVDDIGRALGVEYDDDEELKGGDEIAARDRHRWELDPSSSDDYEDRD